jgi:hypothetical protein
VWLPGIGVTDSLQRSVARRLEAYDERLVLGRHEATGDWCVFLKERANPFGGGKPFPVLGLGTTLPSADEVMAKVQKYDTVRNGERLLREINEHNEKIRAKTDAAASEASGVVAEGAESFLHGLGRTPYKRSLAPKKKTAIPGH